MPPTAIRLTFLLLLSAVLHAALVALAPLWVAPSLPVPSAPERKPLRLRLQPFPEPLPAPPARPDRTLPAPASAPARAQPGVRRAPSTRPAVAAPPAEPAPAAAPATPADPLAAAGQAAPPDTAPAAPPSTLLDAARREAAQFARELNKERGAGKAFRSGRQADIERGFEEAYSAAHRPLYDVITNPLNPGDQILRYKTPFGTVCLWNRDIDRFNPSRGRGTFVTACKQ